MNEFSKKNKNKPGHQTIWIIREMNKVGLQYLFEQEELSLGDRF